MANNYFKFKQFIIYQDKCTMKVCTDACILGAWAAHNILSKQLKIHKCLDVGTGTGLLSLMLAQKTNVFIDAIEIDKDAFMQAGENFKRSCWSERLRALHADVKNYFSDIKYDFIICNPPFYESDLLSPKKNKNIARHDEGLKLNELMVVIKNNLQNYGSFALLLPCHRINYLEDIANENNFFLHEKLLIKPTPDHDYFRGILLFNQARSSPVVKELIIKNNQNYTLEFEALMKDYY